MENARATQRRTTNDRLDRIEEVLRLLLVESVSSELDKQITAGEKIAGLTINSADSSDAEFKMLSMRLSSLGMEQTRITKAYIIEVPKIPAAEIIPLLRKAVDEVAPQSEVILYPNTETPTKRLSVSTQKALSKERISYLLKNKILHRYPKEDEE